MAHPHRVILLALQTRKVITLKVMDTSGNVSTVTAKVSVPNSQNGTIAIDDGPGFTILSNCP